MSKLFTKVNLSRRFSLPPGARKVIHGVNAKAEAYPFVTTSIVATSVAGFADLIQQRYIEHKDWNNLDFKRLQLFTMFGLIIHGWQEYLFVNKFYFWMFPGNTLKSNLKKIAFDAFIGPIIYFPEFYFFKESMLTGKWNYDSFSNGLQHYKIHYKNDLLSIFTLWLPTLFVAITFVPMHLRVPFLILFDFCWLSGLSYFKGDFAIDHEPNTVINTSLTDEATNI